MWALAFLVAVAVTLGLPRALQRARRSPPHRFPPWGLAVVAGTAAGAVLVPGASLHTVVAVGAAAGVALGAVLAADGRLPPAVASGLPWAGAALVVAAGVRLDVTGTGLVDGALALAWIVLVTAAWRLAGRADDVLAVGLALVTAAALAAWAGLGAQHGLARAAAALSGACVAHLAWRAGPEAPTLGEPGRLFLGFVVAALALDAHPVGSPLAHLVCPLLLVAVPLLASRLDPSALPAPLGAVALLGAQALLAATAVTAGRGHLRLAWAATVGVLAAVGLAVAVLRAPAGAEPLAGRIRRPWLLLVVLALLAPVVLVAPALVVLAGARSSIHDGARATRGAMDAVGRGDPDAVAASFERADHAFHRARRRLRGPAASLGLAVPVVADNLRAARTLVDAGDQLVGAGQRLTRIADRPGLRVVNATVQLDEMRRLAPEVAAAVATLRTVAVQVGAIDRGQLIGSVRGVVDAYQAELETALEQGETAADAVRVAPAVLGGEGPRRYFLAVQNNAEARATGGLIGNFGELVVEGGRLRLERFGRLRELIAGGTGPRVLRAPPEYVERYGRYQPADWQNVNMSPDFPTVAQVIADLYPQSGGRPVDGVIGVDPEGLAALLTLTGPVSVPGWPDPIGADNVVDVTLRKAYATFTAKEQRVDFLGDTAQQVVRRLTGADLGQAGRMASVFAGAARGRHLMIYLARPDEQRVIRDLGMAGAVGPVRSDSVVVVTQNAAANKIDYYLRRRLRYTARLTPEGGRARMEGRLDVTLENTAPDEDLTTEVIGPNRPQFAAGENFSYLSVYVPPGLVASRTDGPLVDPQATRELGRRVYSGFVSVPSHSTRTVSFELAGTIPLPGGRYDLELLRQPLVAADEVDVAIELARGWRVAAPAGLRPDGERQAKASLELDSDHTVGLRVARRR